jgi:hypothetical protein
MFNMIFASGEDSSPRVGFLGFNILIALVSLIRTRKSRAEAIGPGNLFFIGPANGNAGD